MPGPCFLRGDPVSLHVVEEADHDFLRRGWNHPEVRPGFGWSLPADVAAIEGRIETFANDDDKESFLVCRHGEPGDGDETESVGEVTSEPVSETEPEPVGEAFLFDLDEQRGRVEIGYWIAPAHQGNGYATAAVKLLVAYLFDQRRLHKVNARVLTFNEGSRRVLERVGFEPEGCRREDFYVDGEYVDADLYGLVADEWRSGATSSAGGSG